MTEEKDTTEEPSEVEKQTIREVIAARQHRLQVEAFEAERDRRRKVRDDRAQQREKARQKEAKQQQLRLRKALKEAEERAQSHVGQASRAISAAIRAMEAVPVRRHTPEGRDQLRTVRALEAALGALRRVGHGASYGESLDEAVDLEAVT